MSSFEIPIKPVSLNAYFYKSKHKTKEAREYETKFKEYLHGMVFPVRDALGVYEVSIVLVHPYDIFFNSEGEVSSRSFDVTNFEKYVQDMIFQHMKENDKYVVKMTSSKEPGDSLRLRIAIQQKPLQSYPWHQRHLQK